MKIRIKFSKEGDLRFIGHLDVMRYFQKAIRRAQIPIKYSAGFNPHQIMSFASPLGIGLTSEGEYMDIEAPQSGPSTEMCERLNAVMAEGARVHSWKLLPDNAKNAMAAFAAADYRVSFRPGYEPENREAFNDAFIAFCGREKIPVEKKTKKSVREVDIRPLIYQVRAEGETYFLQVASGSADHLKPELIFEAFYAERGEELSPFALRIHRLEMYADLGTEDTRKLVPLDALGEDI